MYTNDIVMGTSFHGLLASPAVIATRSAPKQENIASVIEVLLIVRSGVELGRSYSHKCEQGTSRPRDTEGVIRYTPKS